MWFRSYLSNRKQYVSIGESKSLCIDVSVGIPQGSTCGPMLFLLYINDLSRALVSMQTVHFADDTTLYRRFKTFGDISDEVEIDIEHLQEWLKVNRLSLNVSETNFMILSNKSI